MKNAIIYVRVSTEEQAKNDLKSSLEMQKSKCLDYCKQNSLNPVKIIQDIQSGGNDKRKGFLELQKELETGIYDIVVVYEISRISRVASTGLEFADMLSRLSVQFASIMQPQANKFILGILFSIAEEERTQGSQRTKSNKLERAKKGFYQGKAPYGYKNIPNSLEIVEEEAKIVRELFEEYLNSLSFSKLSRDYNISISTVKNILTNRAYTGWFKYGEKKRDNLFQEYKKSKDVQYYKGNYPHIIDEAIFYKVQEAISKKIKINAAFPVILFSGLVECSCGSKMYQEKKTKMIKGVKNISYYYKCNSCNKSFNANKEKLIIEAIKSYEVESGEIEKVDNSKIINKLKKELEQLPIKKQRLMELYTNGLISMEAIKEKCNNFDHEKEKIEIQLKKYTQESKEISTQEILDTKAKLIYILENHNLDDVQSIRKILRMLIKKIKINDIKKFDFLIEL